MKRAVRLGMMNQLGLAIKSSLSTKQIVRLLVAWSSQHAKLEQKSKVHLICGVVTEPIDGEINNTIWLVPNSLLSVSVAKTSQYTHHAPQYDYDYGHYDAGHYDAGHYDAGHYDAGHYY